MYKVHQTLAILRIFRRGNGDESNTTNKDEAEMADRVEDALECRNARQKWGALWWASNNGSLPVGATDTHVSCT